MIGFGAIAEIQTNLAAFQGMERTAMAMPAAASAAWPEIRDVFEFSAFVPPDPLVEEALAAAREPSSFGEKKPLTMIEKYARWLRGGESPWNDRGLMTMADAVRDRLDLGSYARLDEARMRSREIGELLAPGDAAQNGMSDLLMTNAAGMIRSAIYATRARAQG